MPEQTREVAAEDLALYRAIVGGGRLVPPGARDEAPERRWPGVRAYCSPALWAAGRLAVRRFEEAMARLGLARVGRG